MLHSTQKVTNHTNYPHHVLAAEQMNQTSTSSLFNALQSESSLTEHPYAPNKPTLSDHQSVAKLIQLLKQEITRLNSRVKKMDSLLVQKEQYAQGLAMDMQHLIHHMQSMKAESKHSTHKLTWQALWRRILKRKPIQLGGIYS